jgi:hypothetical protein
MLSILTAAAAGYWLCQHAAITRTDEGLTLTVDDRGIIADLQWLWANIAAVMSWVVCAGRQSRNYINGTLNPWVFHTFGFDVPFVPAIALPGEVRAALTAMAGELAEAE